MNEFTRTYDPRLLPGSTLKLEASEAERAALAARFGLVRVDSLTASIDLEREAEGASAKGRLKAKIVQSCAVSGEDLPVSIDEPVNLHFVPARGPSAPDEEIELEAEELDEIEFEGSLFDLGEALAQGLALAIDPYAVGPNAEEARRKAGLLDRDTSGPFAALAALKKAD
ncbi:MAG: YceD family protein [Novosphingobium sp.]